MKTQTKCPNCGRNLAESELYCYFCEMDVLELLNKKIKNKAKNQIKAHKN